METEAVLAYFEWWVKHHMTSWTWHDPMQSNFQHKIVVQITCPHGQLWQEAWGNQAVVVTAKTPTLAQAMVGTSTSHMKAVCQNEHSHLAVPVDPESFMQGPGVLLVPAPGAQWEVEPAFDWSKWYEPNIVPGVFLPNKGNPTPTADKVLAHLVPALFEYFVQECPGTDDDGDHCDRTSGTTITLSAAIQHLNDTHEWRRERIADWLETLKNPDGTKLDLTFQPAQRGD